MLRSFAATTALLSFGFSSIACAAAGEPKLAGHWKLAGDARDAVGTNHGTASGVDFEASDARKEAPAAARFDGRDDVVRVSDAAGLQVGAGEFSVAAWVHVDKIQHSDNPTDRDPRDADLKDGDLDDGVGDVVAKYDASRRRGFHLGVLTNQSATSSQANYRHVQFGIDDGRSHVSVSDCGRPGNAVLIFALAARDGQLYAGTCEAGADEAGHVYRFTGDRRWIDCGSPDRANSVAALAVFEGQLYAATACYRLRGSALADSSNQTPGGKVYRYQSEGRWADCGKLGAAEAINGLAVYGGRLYASSTYSPGVFCYEGGQRWRDVGTPPNRRVEALAVFNGGLFGTGYDAGETYRFRPKVGWQTVGRLPETTQTYGFAVYGGQLYVGTWPTGCVYRYTGDDRWTNCGRLGAEKEVMAMAAYNGQLYAGTLPLAEVYRYDGAQAWTRIAQLDTTPDVKYRRVWSMAVFGGKLYCGTLPAGKVYSLEAGKSVTHDVELPGGWHHLAGVREPGRLRLYVDGRMVGESSAFEATAYDLTNNHPLSIGAGPHDYFHGLLRDVRLYHAALSAEQIAEFARRRAD